MNKYKKSPEDYRRYNQNRLSVYDRIVFYCAKDRAEYARKRAKELNLTLSDYFRALLWADMQGKVEFCGTGEVEKK